MIDQLITEGEQLRSELAGIKTEQSKENVEAFMVKIDRFRHSIKKEQHILARQMDELRGKKSLLSLLDDALKTDHSECRDYMFKLIAEKKEADFGRSPNQL